MANGSQKRTRSERVAALELPPGVVERTWEYLRRRDVVLRLLLCVVAVGTLWGITGSWAPPLGFRTGYTPPRNIVAKVPFKKPDPDATKAARERAASQVRYVYQQDKEPLVQLRAALNNRVLTVIGASSYKELEPGVWEEFFNRPTGGPELTSDELEQHFQQFRQALPSPEALPEFEKHVAAAMASYEKHGILKTWSQKANEGDQSEILVHPKGHPAEAEVVKISDVLLVDGAALKKNLLEKLHHSPEVALRTFDWLRQQLPDTLSLSVAETEQAREKAATLVHQQYIKFAPDDSERNLLAPAGRPLGADDLALLKLEHRQALANRPVREAIDYSLATLGMFVALSTLCGVYVFFYERQLLTSLRRFFTMLALIVVTTGCAVLASEDAWRAELIPLLLFGMTVTIAYDQELALLFSAAVALVIVVSIGQGLNEFVILMAAVATAVALVGHIRSRSKLIYVGLCVAAVSMLTTLGVGTLAEQPLGSILPDALRFGLFCVLAGFLMTGLLPFIEGLFGVQTELSLLEWDVAHPLLQELVRRAPGTYNHSINVASIAEAAAESIDANGLLVRVGAYFHDIGKMLKPGYFVENQGLDASRHASLVPAMSTLIIIAHIKDGADLARQHHLPQPIIDFIQQHHGTTLVEYFYRRANEQSEANPDGNEVEESAFRYPGPKPMTKEAAVLMVADAVESASRALVEPTPSRIESLVHEIAMKRLLDGQFDSCGLTLQELSTIEESLIKSLTAVYHGRVKYPGPKTASA